MGCFRPCSTMDSCLCSSVRFWPAIKGAWRHSASAARAENPVPLNMKCICTLVMRSRYGKSLEAPGLAGTDVDLVPMSLSPVIHCFSLVIASRSGMCHACGGSEGFLFLSSLSGLMASGLIGVFRAHGDGCDPWHGLHNYS